MSTEEQLTFAIFQLKKLPFRAHKVKELYCARFPLKNWLHICAKLENLWLTMYLLHEDRSE